MDYVHLSGNPLSKQQKVFLKSENLKGFNKSQFQDDILNHVDKSMRYLYQVLKHPHNLKKTDLYDKLNALTLADILKNMLLDFEQKTSYKNEKYDFRTVELARTLFHISTNYLLNSPLWNNKEFVKTDIERLSYYYQALADGQLDKEAHELIDEVDERKMNEDLEKIKQDEEIIRSGPDGEWYIFNKQHEACSKKQIDWINKIAILKSQKNQTKEINEEIKLLESLLEERLSAIYKIQDSRESSLKDVKEKRNEIIDKLSHKYDHLSNVYCEYDRLTPFNYKLNPHFPEEHPKNQYRGF